MLCITKIWFGFTTQDLDSHSNNLSTPKLYISNSQRSSNSFSKLETCENKVHGSQDRQWKNKDRDTLHKVYYKRKKERRRERACG